AERKSIHNEEQSGFCILSRSECNDIGFPGIFNKHSHKNFKFGYDYQIKEVGHTNGSSCLSQTPLRAELSHSLGAGNNSSKMIRQILIHLLSVCLLLAASPFNQLSTNVQSIQSVHFKLGPVQPSSRPPSGYVKPAWVVEKKFRKTPSGPNPVGNHQPPSRQ
ncbi:CLAVATA3/ESR (CLE)-related protein 46-like, partial [Quillaja saponaria]